MVKPTCSIDGCDRPAAKRGWCSMHYRRWQSHGDPRIKLNMRNEPPSDRFWAKVDKDGPPPEYRPDLGPCWLWTACRTSDGYGVFSLGGRGRTGRAHRYAYELMIGPIPEGLVIDHLCRVRQCVNPAHLEPVMHGENIRRGDHQCRRVTHCPQGHPYDETNTYRCSDGSRLCRACVRERRRSS